MSASVLLCMTSCCFLLLSFFVNTFFVQIHLVCLFITSVLFWSNTNIRLLHIIDSIYAKYFAASITLWYIYSSYITNISNVLL